MTFTETFTEKIKADFDFSNYDKDHFKREVQRQDWWEADQRIHRPKTETIFGRP